MTATTRSKSLNECSATRRWLRELCVLAEKGEDVPKKPVRLMTPIEYSRARSRLGLRRPEQVSALFGINPRTARRHANGETPIDGPTTALLRLMEEGTITFNDILRVLT